MYYIGIDALGTNALDKIDVPQQKNFPAAKKKKKSNPSTTLLNVTLSDFFYLLSIFLSYS